MKNIILEIFSPSLLSLFRIQPRHTFSFVLICFQRSWRSRAHRWLVLRGIWKIELYTMLLRPRRLFGWLWNTNSGVCSLGRWEAGSRPNFRRRFQGHTHCRIFLSLCRVKSQRTAIRSVGFCCFYLQSTIRLSGQRSRNVYTADVICEPVRMNNEDQLVAFKYSNEQIDEYIEYAISSSSVVCLSSVSGPRILSFRLILGGKANRLAPV